MTERRILFVNPDYHCSFFLRDELRRLGWRADVLRSAAHPTTLLWSDDCLVAPESGRARMKFFFELARQYDYFLCYGDAEVLRVDPRSRVARWITRWYARTFGSWELSYLRKLGKRMVFLPNGCRQEVLRVDFARHQSGRVCENCGWADSVCNDRDNAHIFDLVNRYHSYAIDNTPVRSLRIRKRPFKYKSLDLGVYAPGFAVPEMYRLPSTGSIRVLHSFFDANRTHGGKNIKGSPFVMQAIERLRSEGLNVEYIHARDTPLQEMRFLQAQADIVVDQLIYGWWGSTAIESMALGKPTVCFLWPEWKETFLSDYPEYKDLPIVEATTGNIYEVLKDLVLNPERRAETGRAARRFAERHFDVRKNAPLLSRLLESL